MKSQEVIEADISADGAKRWELVRRCDGFFVYSEDTVASDDLREFGGDILEYWSPTFFSGLFETAEEARADALGNLPWLRHLKSVD